MEGWLGRRVATPTNTTVLWSRHAGEGGAGMIKIKCFTWNVGNAMPNEAQLQEWLPTTMLAFARQTGAGGFSFDYTYFEQHGDFHTGHRQGFYASQVAQWAGWRTVLAALHADKTACAGARSEP